MDNMRVFDTFKQGKSRAKKLAQKKAAKEGKALRPERLRLSAQEIRNKVAENTTNAKAPKPVTGKKLGVGFMDDAVKVEVDKTAKSINLQSQKQKDIPLTPKQVEAEIKEPLSDDQAQAKAKELAADEPVIGDVGKNDPNDPTTKEKLKNSLGMGAFGFSEKERAVLENILGKQ